jgi:hypothetical protein
MFAFNSVMIISPTMFTIFVRIHVGPPITAGLQVAINPEHDIEDVHVYINMSKNNELAKGTNA